MKPLVDSKTAYIVANVWLVGSILHPSMMGLALFIVSMGWFLYAYQIYKVENPLWV